MGVVRGLFVGLVAVGLVVFGGSGQGKVAGVESKGGNGVRGIILPHHDVARELILEAVGRPDLNFDITHIVVLAPNHFRPGSYVFSSSDEVAQFPIATELVARLKEWDDQAVLDRKLLANEHGVVLPMRYLHSKFTRAKFLPIIISGFGKREKLAGLAEFLEQNLPRETLFVVSVDFAHERMELEAMAKNGQTIKAIKSFDYETVLGFGDDHLDSPGAMTVWLRVMERLGATSWETWHDSHGAVLTGKPTLQGTSYVIGVFRQ